MKCDICGYEQTDEELIEEEFHKELRKGKRVCASCTEDAGI